MDKERDLLPWILAGLLTAAAAIAIIVSTNTQAPSPANAARRPVATTLPPAAAQIGSIPAPVPALSAAPTQTNIATTPSANLIWECTANGQRTFSNNPCGEKASIREIGPVNRMDPTPLFQPARSYAAQTSYEPDYIDPGAQDAAENSYPRVVAIPFIERRRFEHAHRPHGHDRGPRRKD